MPAARLAARRRSSQARLARGDAHAARRSRTPELAVERDAVAAEAHHRRRRVELGHEPRRVVRRAAGQLALLDQQDVLPPGPGEVVGDAAPGDPAADDDDRLRSGSTRVAFSAVSHQSRRGRDAAIGPLVSAASRWTRCWTWSPSSPASAHGHRAPGRADQRQPQGRRPTRGAYVVRRWSDDTGLLAIDRDNEHENSVRAAEVGRRGAGRRLPARAQHDGRSSSSRARR